MCDVSPLSSLHVFFSFKVSESFPLLFSFLTSSGSCVCSCSPTEVRLFPLTEPEQRLLQERGNGVSHRRVCLRLFFGLMPVSRSVFTDRDIQKGSWKKPCEVIHLPGKVWV